MKGACSMLPYIKTAFQRPKEIYIGRNMKRSHYFSLVSIMVLVLTLLSFFEFVPPFIEFQNDLTEIKAAIPDFELHDNTLVSNEDSFVYMTDSIAFYFDPEDRMTSQLIDSEMATHSAPVSIGILDKELYFNFMGVERSFFYSESNALDTQLLDSLIDTFGTLSINTILLFLFFLLIFNSIVYITQLLTITLFSNIIRFSHPGYLNFIQTAKVTLLASFIPFVTTYALNAFQFRVPYQVELILISTLVIFYMSLKEMKNRLNSLTQ
jgi:hypothetical protein